MVALGVLGVVGGGLVAAATGPMGWTKGSWAAAYLVLVVGVAQYVMGRMREGLPAPDGAGWLQLAAWDLGSLGVVVGTLVGVTAVVDVGSLVLVVALALALQGDLRAEGARPRAVVLGYRLMLLGLLVSIPIGMLLSHLRNG